MAYFDDMRDFLNEWQWQNDLARLQDLPRLAEAAHDPFRALEVLMEVIEIIQRHPTWIKSSRIAAQH